MEPLEAGDPSRIGEYRLLGRLGAGGMGRVYLGRSPGGRTVAVKVVHPHFSADDTFRSRFRREVEAARRVGGDWTAPVLDADPDAEVPWAATGYVAGPALSEAVREHGALEEQAVRALGAGLAEALHHIHGLGLVHRDVKPSNVLLAVDGPRLIDFGIARATEGTTALTASGVSVGSPGYMAPEQVLGRETGAAADVFSLGAVLAFAARGEAPFAGEHSAVLLYKVVHEEPELDGVPEDLRPLIGAALAKEPALRPGPRRMARALAGPEDGARELVGAGWLPQPVVEQAGRSAAALLDLEARDPVPASAGPAVREAGSAPVVPPVPDASFGVPRQGAVRGEFGPPDPSYGSAAQPSGAEAGADGWRRGFRAVLRAGGRSRASCAVVVTLSAAVAGVGSIFVPTTPPSGPTGDGAPPAASRPSAPRVPGEFTGTWEGPSRGSGGMTNGVLTARVKQGLKGDEVLRLDTRISAGGEEYHCRGTGRVEKITEKKLTFSTEPSGKSPVVLGMRLCTRTPGEAVLRIRDGGGLDYEWTSPEASSTAELSRVRG